MTKIKSATCFGRQVALVPAFSEPIIGETWWPSLASLQHFAMDLAPDRSRKAASLVIPDAGAQDEFPKQSSGTQPDRRGAFMDELIDRLAANAGSSDDVAEKPWMSSLQVFARRACPDELKP